MSAPRGIHNKKTETSNGMKPRQNIFVPRPKFQLLHWFLSGGRRTPYDQSRRTSPAYSGQQEKRSKFGAGLAWIVLGIVFSIALGLIFYSNNAFYQEFLYTAATYTKPATKVKAKKAWIEIDFGERKRLFEGDIGKYIYTLDAALKSVAREGDFAIKTRAGKITEIAGVTGPWKIYKNGEEAEGPPNQLAISAGDSYALRLEKK